MNNLTDDNYKQSDQIITGRNDTRRNINRKLRELLNREGKLPVEGDKLIFLRNGSGIYRNWNGDWKRAFLVSGTQCIAASDTQTIKLKKQQMGQTHRHRIDVKYKGKLIEGLSFYDWHFLSHYEGCPERMPENIIDLWQVDVEMDYAYAITTHKAQGSEWDSVLCDFRGIMETKMAPQTTGLAYTGMTRAKENCRVLI